MKNILYVVMLVCSLFIIACDSGGSGSNGPLSGGCTTEAAEGTWEQLSGVDEASGYCILPVQCECYDSTCEDAWEAAGYSGTAADCPGGDYDAASDEAGLWAYDCETDTEGWCGNLVVNSDGSFTGPEGAGDFECSADGTQATIYYDNEQDCDCYDSTCEDAWEAAGYSGTAADCPGGDYDDGSEVITVYISGDSMTLTQSGVFELVEGLCYLYSSSTYLRTGDASGN